MNLVRLVPVVGNGNGLCDGRTVVILHLQGVSAGRRYEIEAQGVCVGAKGT